MQWSEHAEEWQYDLGQQPPSPAELSIYFKNELCKVMFYYKSLSFLENKITKNTNILFSLIRIKGWTAGNFNGLGQKSVGWLAEFFIFIPPFQLWECENGILKEMLLGGGATKGYKIKSQFTNSSTKRRGSCVVQKLDGRSGNSKQTFSQFFARPQKETI